MLILTRRIGEAIVIGCDITVTVLGAKRNQVQIGITAPISVEVIKKELYQQGQLRDFDRNSPEAETDIGPIKT